MIGFVVQLDQFPSTDCVTGRAFYSNLTDGDHNFSVAVNSSSGAVGASEFGWTIGERLLSETRSILCTLKKRTHAYTRPISLARVRVHQQLRNSPRLTLDFPVCRYRSANSCCSRSSKVHKRAERDGEHNLQRNL